MPPLFRPARAREAITFFTVRGCMKSGTNWLGNLLNLHPKVFCHGEFHWERLWLPLESLTVNRPLFRHRRRGERLVRRMQRVVEETLLDFAPEGVTVVGDRTPWSLEPVVLPGAKQITIQRDGRDVLVSRAYHLLARPDCTKLFEQDEIMRDLLETFQRDEHYFESHPHELLASETFVRETGKLWSRVMASDHETRQRQPELPVLTVRYEQLHENTDQVRDELYRFLGVDPTEAAPLDELTRPGFSMTRPSDHYRSGKVGEWRKYLTPQAKQWFDDEAGEWLRVLGYDLD